MEFDKFSGQSFEQLIQALAVHQFGAGMTIFGPGRDGGREAVFRGALPTFEAKGWDGYTVIQAKCKERPNNDSRDASWLCGQLRAEFKKFLDNKDLERPEYYLLCTNVQLSAVPKVGGKQQVEEVFEEHREALGLKGWHVWSADELRSLLAGAAQIRQTFASWITPGDVLFELMEQLVGPDLKQAIPLVLSRELRSDRDARLRDAGQETDQAVYLERVFIDLPVDLPMEVHFIDSGDLEFIPVLDNSDFEPNLVEADHDSSHEGFMEDSLEEVTDTCVASLFNLAADRLDPKSVDASCRGKRVALRNRVVILGGPGQGKSTLGQFVVQVARARLLSASEKLQLNPETTKAIEQILAAAQDLDIPLNGPARIPVRIDLPMFADAMSKAGEVGISILGFLSKRFTDVSGCNVTPHSMRSLLQRFPWIMIFDGLDEVPPSSNRQEVVKAIETFWDDVYSVGGDVLAVVTSRPQGYDNDLSPEFWQHWKLLPLTPKYAIDYAAKLGAVRVSEQDRRDAILDDISSACSDPSTSLLTTSPLQVTILFGISFLKGSIPQDRWELFDRYYNLLREREAQKPGPTAKFIRDQKRMIDAIHQTSGWILQAEAEATGRNFSYLNNDQFKRIIAALLRDEGYESEAISDLTGRLATIATDRLVLLASRVEGQISFDVRSLQEYMAAAKIVGSDQHLLMQRLRTIAPSAHWRHVFRIAASKIFSITEMGHLRADVISICDALDKGDLDKAAPFVATGATLALDLLADGIATHAPRFYRDLFVRAVTLLDTKLDPLDRRLADVATVDGGKLLLEEVESRLNGNNFVSQCNALTMLLIVQHIPGAQRLLDKFFGFDSGLILRILSSVDMALVPKTYRNQVKQMQIDAGEAASSAFLDGAFNDKERSHGFSDWALHPELSRISRGTSSRVTPTEVSSRVISAEVAGNASIKIFSLEAQLQLYRALETELDGSDWPMLGAARRFAEDPSPEGLASYISSIATLPANTLGAVLYDLPWPLLAVNSDLRERGNGAELADLAQQGAMGTLADWLQAERRWQSAPLAADDFLNWNSGLYLSSQLCTCGPPPVSRISARTNKVSGDVDPFLDVASRLNTREKRETLLWLISASLRNSRSSDIGYYVERIFDIYFELDGADTPFSPKGARLFSLGPPVWSDKRVVEMAHRYGLEGQRVQARLDDVIDAFNANPSLRGLLAQARVPISAGLQPRSLARPCDAAFLIEEDDPAPVRAGIALLKLRFDILEGLDIEQAAVDLVSRPLALADAARILKAREPRDSVRQELAFQLARQVRIAGREPEGLLSDLLRANVSAAPTAVAEVGVAQSLGLPRLV